MFKPSSLSEPVKRRTVIGFAVAGATGLVSYAPRAHAAATLPADISIQQWTMGKYNDVFKLSFAIENHTSHQITPVATLWGVARQTQHPWRFLQGPETLAAGESGEYRIRALGDHEAVRVHPDKPAQLTIYDKGTEARAIQHFTPSDYPEVHRDAQ